MARHVHARRVVYRDPFMDDMRDAAGITCRSSRPAWLSLGARRGCCAVYRAGSRGGSRGVGLALGSAGAVAAGGLLESMLFGVEPAAILRGESPARAGRVLERRPRTAPSADTRPV